jgi:hypothetical protein
MNELRLPDPPPLPADVRARVGVQLLDRMDAPQPSRLPLIAAGLVVLALAASTVAVLGFGGAPPLQPAGPPALSGNVLVDNALRRCAAAVDGSVERSAWPSTSTWHTTDVFLGGTNGRQESDVAIAINDGFACFAGASDVAVTATTGPGVGGGQTARVQTVRLAPGLVVLLNPQRQTLGIVPDALQRFGRPNAPVQMLALGGAGMSMADFRLTVAGVDAGRLPEPAPIGMVAQDRPSMSRAPEPPGTSLADCLTSALPGARTLVTHNPPGGPAGIAGTADGRYAGFCVDTGSSPVFRGADVPGGTGPRVVLAPAPDAVGPTSPTVALLAVPDTVTRVEIATGSGPPAACTLGSGFALCTLATTSPVTVTAYTGSKATPVPLL